MFSIRSRIRFFYLSLFIAGIVPTGSYATSETQTTFQLEEISEKQAVLNEQYAAFHDGAANLTILIERLGNIISQTNLLAPLQRTKTLEWLQKLHKKAKELMQMQFPLLTETALTKPVLTYAQICAILAKAAQDQFKILPNPSLTNLPTTISSDNMTKTLLKAKQNLQSIEYITQKNGLSSFNIFYRSVSQKLMEYQIPQLVFSSCVAAGIGVYIFSQLDPNYLPDERATRWQEKLSKFGTKTATAMIHLKIISKVPDILNKLGLSKACEKIYQTIDNRLRGQELLVQAQKKEYVADITLDDPCFDYLRPILDPFYRIADFLRRPEQYSFTGLKNCQAILLIAPPGFGKSFTARAAAGLFNQAAGRTAFISINSIDLFKKARNSEAVLNSIIEDAKANAPCILWLDELHLLMGGLQIDKNSFMLDDILKALDTLNQNADPERMVFIIGATNRPDLLDKALLRPGRFSQIISLPQPTAHDRTNLLESFCKQTAIDPSVINLPYIAAITVDASPSTLKSVFEYGHFLAKRENCCLETKHLYEAVNRIVRNIQPYTPYTPEEKNEIAARIAGQVLYCSKFNQTNLIDAATISPIRKEIKEVYDWMTKIPNDAGANLFATQKGQVFFATEGNYFISQDFLESLAAQYISLEVLQIPTTSKEVIEARNYIYATLLQKYSGGISLEKLAKKHAELIKQEAFTAVQEIENKVRERLSLEKNTLSLLQNTLLERSFLPKESIMDALEQASKTR